MNTWELQPPYGLQRFNVIRVNGEFGAKNFKMAPNSSVLLLDETAPIVWYAQTDGAGYLTVTPFDITPHQVQEPVSIESLSERISRLEEALANVQQSDTSTTRTKKPRRPQQSGDSTNQKLNESDQTE